VVKRFSVPGAYGVTSDYTVDGCDINQSGFCDGYFQAPVPINIDNYLPSETGSVGPGNWGTPVSIDLEGTDVNTPYTFPFAPSPNYDWNRGLVLSESYFNNTGSLVKLTDFQYQLFTPQNLGVKYVNGLKKGRLLNYAMTVNGGGSPAYSAGIPRYDVIAAYQILAQVCKVPLYKTTYYYDQVSGKTVQDSIIYNYQYNNMLPTSQVHYESDGSTTTQYTKYITDIDTSQTTAIMTMQGYYNMLRNHKVYDIVERYTQVSRAGNAATTISGNFITYKPSMAKPDSSFRIKSSLPLTNFSPSTTLYNSYIKDSRYEALTLFDQYDAEENILQQHKIYDEDHSYIWDYGNSYSVAEVSNASPSNIAYTSFEADGGGNWTIPDTTRNRTVSITGNISYSLKSSNTITKSGLNSSTNYIVSYWSQNGPLTISNGTTGLAGITLGIWTYYEHQVSGAGSVSVSGTAVIDELRLYPKGALMSTYTYIPMVGMTTHCDESNRIAYYIYDAFGRLKLIKDQYGNILKRYDYEYQTTNQ